MLMTMKHWSVHGPRKQRGAGKLILLLLLAVLVFCILLATRLVPVYVDHYYARSIVTSLLSETEDTFDRRQFLADFRRQADMNQVDLASSVFTFSGTNPVHIELAYERRIPVLFNIDAVISFGENYTYP